MYIVKADQSSVKLIGQIHSRAWKQAYKNIFPDEYIFLDSAIKREQECRETLQNKSGIYYLIDYGNISIGIIKISVKEREVYEIESIYILEEYQGKGYGTAAIDFIKNELSDMTIILWVLENNHNAINFYKKNKFVFSGMKRQIDRGNTYTQLLFTYNS